jgi:Fe-S cluster assembly protein SufD
MSENLPQWIENQYSKAVASSSKLIEESVRSQALETIKKNGFPTRRQEEWKYTDISSFLKTDYKTPVAIINKNQIDTLISKYIGENYNFTKLVFVNGVYNQELSDSTLPTGVSLCDYQVGNDIKLKSDVNSAFTALNLACSTSGIALEVEKNKIIEKPILVLSVVTKDSKDSAIYPRLLINAKENSSVKVLECNISEEDNNYLSSAVTEIFLGANAQVEQLILNQQSKNAFSYNNTTIKQQATSNYRSTILNFGSALTRNEIEVNLLGEGANTTIGGVNVLEKTQQVDNFTIMEHAVPHCESKQVFKGVYNDKSQGVFDGTIIVRPDAQKTNAIQSSQSLLLTDQANSYSKPQLKIWADDVKCTHGATVGQIDEQALFYLRSRGIPEKDAKQILLLAFVSEVLADVKDLDLKNIAQDLLFNRLFEQV